MATTDYIYKMSAWQRKFQSLPHNEALGAGSAGPGKTRCLIAEPFQQIKVEHDRCANKAHPKHIQWGTSRGHALFLRRTFPMLAQTIDMTKTIFPRMDPGVKWDEESTTWTFSSGYKYQFGHCKDPDSWERYIGNEYTIIMFDELVQFLENQYEMIRTRLRTSDPVLSKMLKVRAMSNPTLRRQKGGDDFVVNDPQWVRRYFVDKAQQGNVTLKKRLVRGDGTVFFRTRIYLPATLYDNPDPEFVRQYEETLLNEKPHIRAAMLYGDWYVQPGSYYADAWNKKIHVCKPFVIPDDWRVCRSMDWGYKVNGVIHWWAIDPDGNAFCVYEYVFKGKLADYVANEVQRIEKRFGWWHGKKSLLTGPADTQLWEARGDVSKSKAATFSELGVGWQQADKRSRKNNALLLIGRLEDHQNGTTTPGIVFFDRCPYIISTLPSIQEDPTDSEEPLEGGEDHAHDSVVYFCAYASHGLKGSKAIGTRKDDDFPDDEDGESSDDRGRLGYGAQA